MKQVQRQCRILCDKMLALTVTRFIFIYVLITESFMDFMESETTSKQKVPHFLNQDVCTFIS